MLESIINLNQDRNMRTFVFQKEDTQQSVIIDYEIDFSQDLLDLNALFQRHCPLQDNRVSIYDPALGRFASLFKLGAESGLIPRYLLQPSVILIRFIKFSEIVSESDSLDSSMEESRGERSQKKEGRSKERTIAEVIEVVKKWRQLHLHGHKSIKKRLNLQDAAKLVGVPKKSLDDYYCQLRLGELYHFDFYNRLHEKMGVLRTYVKNYRPSKEQTIRRQNDKHPKNLRIINEFDLSTRSLKPLPDFQEDEEAELPMLVSRNESESLVRMQQQKQEVGEARQMHDLLSESESNPIYKELFNLENEFFKGFEVPMDYQSDPYYDMDRDFRKKDYEFDSNSFLFFQ